MGGSDGGGVPSQDNIDGAVPAGSPSHARLTAASVPSLRRPTAEPPSSADLQYRGGAATCRTYHALCVTYRTIVVLRVTPCACPTSHLGGYEKLDRASDPMDLDRGSVGVIDPCSWVVVRS